MSSEIAGLIKRAALEAVLAQKPADLLFGRVQSTAPLKIQTDQKLVLDERCLILSSAVTNRSIDISVSAAADESVGYSFLHSHTYSGTTALSNHINVEAHDHTYSGSTDQWGFTVPGHSHNVRGKKKVILHLGLREGEKVILLRLGGGQRFLVLDRVDGPETEGEWIDDT